MNLSSNLIGASSLPLYDSTTLQEYNLSHLNPDSSYISENNNNNNSINNNVDDLLKANNKLIKANKVAKLIMKAIKPVMSDLKSTQPIIVDTQVFNQHRITSDDNMGQFILPFHFGQFIYKKGNALKKVESFYLDELAKNELKNNTAKTDKYTSLKKLPVILDMDFAIALILNEAHQKNVQYNAGAALGINAIVDAVSYPVQGVKLLIHLKEEPTDLNLNEALALVEENVKLNFRKRHESIVKQKEANQLIIKKLEEKQISVENLDSSELKKKGIKTIIGLEVCVFNF